MADNSLTLISRSTERKVFIVAIVVSLLFHIILLVFIKFDLFRIFETPVKAVNDIEPVTFLFPENKPRKVVENMNENQLVPDDANLLSESNSQARSNILLDDQRNLPYSEGNTELENLAESNPIMENEQEFRPNYRQNESFNRDALLENKESGAAMRSSRKILESGPAESSARRKNDTDNMLRQIDFSSNMLGDISLSTYAWEWAPYMNAFKRKLYQKWRVPAGYYLFGIKGKTVINFTIDRKGNLVKSEIVSHEGHESLQISSELVIKNCFPFLPLPVSFPDDSLDLQFNLIYPGVEKRNR